MQDRLYTDLKVIDQEDKRTCQTNTVTVFNSWLQWGLKFICQFGAECNEYVRRCILVFFN